MADEFDAMFADVFTTEPEEAPEQDTPEGDADAQDAPEQNEQQQEAQQGEQPEQSADADAPEQDVDSNESQADASEQDAQDTPDNPQEAQQQEEAPEQERYVSFGFGGSSIHLTQRTAQELSAKLGDDIGKLAQDAASYRAAGDALTALQDFCAVNHTDFAGAAKLLEERITAAVFDPIMSALREKHPHSDPAVLEDIAQRKAQEEMQQLRSTRKPIASYDPAKAAEDRMVAGFNRMFAEFGLIEPHDIPEDVLKESQNGGDPVVAMYRLRAAETAAEMAKLQNRITELEQEVKTAEKNSSNKQKSPGSAAGSAGEMTEAEKIASYYL